MSWEEAQKEASEWLGKQRLGRDLIGQEINLADRDLPFTGTFRNMVLEAIRRKLVKRRAKEIILPPRADV